MELWVHQFIMRNTLRSINRHLLGESQFDFIILAIRVSRFKRVKKKNKTDRLLWIFFNGMAVVDLCPELCRGGIAANDLASYDGLEEMMMSGVHLPASGTITYSAYKR